MSSTKTCALMFDPAAGWIGGLSLFLCDHTEQCLPGIGPSELQCNCLVLRHAVHNAQGEMRPVSSGFRSFDEVNPARSHLIWSPGSCRWSWGWQWSQLC